MKRILVDVDGVVADLMPEWLRLYNEEWVDNLLPKDITGWDIAQFVKEKCGKDVYKYLDTPFLYDYVSPVDGAISSIHWLRQHGYDVRFVTSGVRESKIHWLGQQGLLLDEHYLSSRDVIVAHDKSVIKADIMIDDNISNCNGFSGVSILFAQPWNTSPQTGHYRADNWPDVIQYLARRYS